MTLVEINGAFVNPDHVVAVAPAPDEGGKPVALATSKGRDAMIWCVGGPQQNIRIQGMAARDVAKMLTPQVIRAEEMTARAPNNAGDSDALETFNRWMVTGHGEHVVMMLPPMRGQLLTPAEAFHLAAWLLIGIELAEADGVMVNVNELERFVDRLRNA